MRFFVNRPVLSIMFFCGILLLGVYSLKNLPVELVPSAKLPELTVSLFWNNMPPEIILKRAAIPIEEEVMQLKWVKGVKTRCNEGVMRMDVSFLRNADMEFTYILLKERLNRLKKKLPPSTSKIEVSPFVPEEFKKRPFLTLIFFGNSSLRSTRKIVERDILPLIRGIKGVRQVKLWGGSSPEVKINLNAKKLSLYKITPLFVEKKILDEFYTISSVNIRNSGGEFNLILSNLPEKIEDMENVLLLNKGDISIKLKDVGSVYRGFQKVKSEKRYNGFPVIGLDVYKKRGFSSFKFSRCVTNRLKETIYTHHIPLKLKVIGDESKELRDKLGKLIKLSLFILLLIFLILFFATRSLKVGILLFLSLIFSLFFSVSVIYFLKIPVNILTLSGFALGFGMLVDNSVVVVENILKKKESGVNPEISSIEGAKEVFLPVLFSTFTTIIVFFSFAYFHGRLRIYYLPLAETILITLLSSIIVSFTVIPALSKYLKYGKVRSKISKFQSFKRVLLFFLKYPMFLVLPILLLILLSGKLFYENVYFGKFFSWYGKERLNVWLKLPEGSNFSETKKAILQFEKLALCDPYKKDVEVDIVKNEAFMEVTFPESAIHSPYPYLLKEKLISLASNLAGVGISISGFDSKGYYYSPSFSLALPYSIELRGYDFERLKKLSNDLKETLLLNKRIRRVSVIFEKSFIKGGEKKIYIFKPSFSAMREFEINPMGFLFSIYTLLNPENIAFKMKIGETEYPVSISGGEKKVSLQKFMNFLLSTHNGIRYRPEYAGKLYKTYEKGGIERIDQEFLSIVEWDYLGSEKRGERLKKTIFKNLTLPPGFKKVKEKKQWKLQSEEKREFKLAIIVSLLLIYILLSMLYESFVKPVLVMLTIPLALIGVFLVFYIFDFPFDSTAYVGVILLCGIVVNNAIVLVSHIDTLKERRGKLAESVVEATCERIRPIFITTFTTVVGVLPLVISSIKGSVDVWSSLALATLGGLTTSSILTIFVVPVFYYLIEKYGWRKIKNL